MFGSQTLRPQTYSIPPTIFWGPFKGITPEIYEARGELGLFMTLPLCENPL